MEIRSLILDNTLEANEKVNNVKRTKPTVTYKVEVCSGCDFAISRNTTKTQQLFVVLMSQNQFYIKNGNVTENINQDNMAKFFANMDNPIHLDSNWITAMQKGKDFANYFCNLLIEDFAAFAKAGMFGATGNYSCDITQKRMYKANPALYKYMIHKISSVYNLDEMVVKCGLQNNDSGFACKNTRTLPEKAQCIFDRFESADLFSYKFGIEYGKQFIDEFLVSYATQLPRESYLRDLFGEAEFQPQRLIEYIFYDVPRQGYGISGWRDDMNSAISELRDTLAMQKILYGKIRDKYPEYLSSLHVKLSTMVRIRRELIDAAGFENAVEEMKQYEWKPNGSKWQIICPKNKEDMIDEANQQQNCLASYVSRVSDGTSRIYFLRSSNENLKDKSVVTIETKGTKIVQIKARNNREANKEHLDFIEMWARNKNLTMEV